MPRLRTCARSACANHVKDPRQIWCSPQCVPKEARVESGRKGGEANAYRRDQQRLTRYREYFARLRGQSITWEDICALLDAEARKGYQAGYHQRDRYWRRIIAGDFESREETVA